MDHLFTAVVPQASLASDEEFWDAVVIGSGAGGSSIALRLGQSGRRVLVVERGDFLKPAPGSVPQGRYIYHVIKDANSPLSVVGGQTKFYGAALYRMRESDFRGIRRAGGQSPAWPISYADLEPFYGEAEEVYKVHGAVGDDPSEPPRSSAYPHPPLPHHPLVERMIERLAQSGTRVSSIPRALDFGPDGKCVLCAECDAYYCPFDAKLDAEIAALRPALATGNVRILTNAECLRIETDLAGTRATGVLLRTREGSKRVHAGTVVVSAGFRETAPLLRRSRTGQHRHGLGNQGGALGRYYSGHSVGYLFPMMGIRKLPPIHSKTMAINAFHDGAPDFPYPLGIIQMAGQMPFWELSSGLMRLAAKFVGQRSLTCFYSTEALPTPDSGLVFEGDEVAAIIQPRHDLAAFSKLRRLAVQTFQKAGYPVIARKRPPYLWQETGTACMGEDPAHSVVDPNCQVHGVKDLYVVDQTVLPSAGTVNTALTVTALALRAGDHIIGARKEKVPLRQAAASPGLSSRSFQPRVL